MTRVAPPLLGLAAGLALAVLSAPHGGLLGAWAVVAAFALALFIGLAKTSSA
ncbi:MAG: hypothetical protein ACR2M0_16760 [Chloroflexia bacterium]